MSLNNTPLKRLVQAFDARLSTIAMIDYRAEVRLNDKIYRCATIVYAVCQCVNVYEIRSVMWPAANDRYRIANMMRLSVYGYMIVYLTVFMISIYQARSSTSRLHAITFSHVILKLAFIFVIMPLSNWAHTSSIIDNLVDNRDTISSISLVQDTSAIFTTNIIATIVIRRFTSSLPRYRGMSSISTTRELSVMAMAAVCQAVMNVGVDVYASHTLYVAVRLLIVAIMAVVYVCLVALPLYWNIEVSIWMATCYSWILIVNLICTVTDFGSNPMHGVYMIVSFTFSVKLTRNLMILRLKYLVGSYTGCTSYEGKVVTFIVDMLADKIKKDTIADDIKQLLNYMRPPITIARLPEVGRTDINRKSSASTVRRPILTLGSINNKTDIRHQDDRSAGLNQKSSEIDYINEMIRQYTDRGISSLSLDDSVWLLRAMTLRFIDNIGLVSLAICRIKSMQRNRILKSSEYMIIEQIIGYLYITVANDAGSVIDANISTYDDILSGMDIDDGGIEVEQFGMKQILQCKDAALYLSSYINKGIQDRIDLFMRLLHGGKQCVVDYIGIHKAMSNQNDKIIGRFEELIKLQGCSTYMIALYNSYIIAVLHRYDKSSSLFKDYKRRLNLVASSMRHSKHQSCLPLDINSVVISMSIETGRQGLILNSTVDSSEYFGRVAGVAMIGSNINSLLPDVFDTVHRAAMAAGSVANVLNRNNRFYVNGLDGEFREIDFVLKLNSEFSQGSSIFAKISPKKKKDSISVLLDSRFRVIGAEQGFWNVIDTVKHGSRTLSFLEVSEQVCIIAILKDICSLVVDSNEDSEYSLLVKKLSLIEKVRENFKQYKDKPIICSFKNQGVFWNQLKDISIIAQSELQTFCGMPYYRVDLQFDHSSSRYYRQLMIAQRQINGGRRDNTGLDKWADVSGTQSHSEDIYQEGLGHESVPLSIMTSHNDLSELASNNVQFNVAMRSVRASINNLQRLSEIYDASSSLTHKYLWKWLFNYFLAEERALSLPRTPNGGKTTRNRLAQHLCFSDALQSSTYKSPELDSYQVSYQRSKKIDELLEINRTNASKKNPGTPNNPQTPHLGPIIEQPLLSTLKAGLKPPSVSIDSKMSLLQIPNDSSDIDFQECIRLRNECRDLRQREVTLKLKGLNLTNRSQSIERRISTHTYTRKKLAIVPVWRFVESRTQTGTVSNNIKNANKSMSNLRHDIKDDGHVRNEDIVLGTNSKNVDAIVAACKVSLY